MEIYIIGICVCLLLLLIIHILLRITNVFAELLKLMGDVCRNVAKSLK